MQCHGQSPCLAKDQDPHCSVEDMTSSKGSDHGRWGSEFLWKAIHHPRGPPSPRDGHDKRVIHSVGFGGGGGGWRAKIDHLH